MSVNNNIQYELWKPQLMKSPLILLYLQATTSKGTQHQKILEWNMAVKKLHNKSNTNFVRERTAIAHVGLSTYLPRCDVGLHLEV